MAAARVTPASIATSALRVKSNSTAIDPGTGLCWCFFFVDPEKNCSTLPETNSSPLQMDGWKTTFLLGRPVNPKKNAPRGYSIK